MKAAQGLPIFFLRLVKQSNKSGKIEEDPVQEVGIFISSRGLVHQGALDEQTVQREIHKILQSENLINHLENRNSGDMLAQELGGFQNEFKGVLSTL